MAYTPIKVGNSYEHSNRMTFMIESAADLEHLPTDVAVDSFAKTVDYSVIAYLGIDRVWHQL